MKARASRIMLVQKPALHAFVVLSLAIIQQCHASFNIAENGRILQDGDSYWRYVLIFEGMTTDEGACVKPDPVASISSGDAEIELVDSGESSCIPEDQSLVCQGSGTVIFDVFDSIGGALLRIDMQPLLGPTSCTGTVSQAFTLGLVCPDGKVSYETTLRACVPESAFFLKENTTVPLCVATCGDSCTERVLGEISTEVSHYSCLWPSGEVADRPIEEPEIEVDPEDMAELVESPSASPTERAVDAAPTLSPTLSTPDILRDTTPAQPPSAVFHPATDPPAKAENGVSVTSISGAHSVGSGLFSAAVLGFVASFLLLLL